jgi:hypothetical protein
MPLSNLTLLVPYGYCEIARSYCVAPVPVHSSVGVVEGTTAPVSLGVPGEIRLGADGTGVGAVLTVRFADADPPEFGNARNE